MVAKPPKKKPSPLAATLAGAHTAGRTAGRPAAPKPYNPYVADRAFNHPVRGIEQPFRSIRRKAFGLPGAKP